MTQGEVEFGEPLTRVLASLSRSAALVVVLVHSRHQDVHVTYFQRPGRGVYACV